MNGIKTATNRRVPCNTGPSLKEVVAARAAGAKVLMEKPPASMKEGAAQLVSPAKRGKLREQVKSGALTATAALEWLRSVDPQPSQAMVAWLEGRAAKESPCGNQEKS